MLKRLLGNVQLTALYTLAAFAILPTGCGSSSAPPVAIGGVLSGQFSQPAAESANPGGSNTTSAFGIPAGLTGSVEVGQQLFTSTCTACHSSNMSSRNFNEIAAALANVGAMRSLNLTDQQIADVTAYLNRDSIPSQDPPPPSTEPPAPPADNPPTTGPGTGDDNDDDAFDDDSGDDNGDDEGDDAFDDDSGDDEGDDAFDDDSVDDEGDDAFDDDSGDDGGDDEIDDNGGSDDGAGAEDDDGQSGDDDSLGGGGDDDEHEDEGEDEGDDD